MQLRYLFEQDCQKGRLQGAVSLTFGSLFGPLLAPGAHLGALWGPRTSKKRDFLGDLVLDRILHRFWAPSGGGPRAIHSPIAMFAKGRPFAKKSDFESILSSFWSRNGDQNPNSTPFRTPRSDSWRQFSRSENHSKKSQKKKTSRRAHPAECAGSAGGKGGEKTAELWPLSLTRHVPCKQGAADFASV